MLLALTALERRMLAIVSLVLAGILLLAAL
jgi:hypothetical protein